MKNEYDFDDYARGDGGAARAVHDSAEARLSREDARKIGNTT
jgi:hypothetical protein